MKVLEVLSHKTIYPLQILGVDVSITSGVITLWVSVIIVYFFFQAVSRNLKLVPGTSQNIAEIIVIFLKNEVLGQLHDGRKKWVPFIVALFAFILMNNLLALVPGVVSSTGNINTTAALAVIVFLVVHIAGILKNGFLRYLKSFIPEGMPLFMLIFFIPIELVAQLARPFSLAIRLFANMFAGHAVMFMIIGLIFVFKSYYIIPFPVIGNALVLAFEVFIAFIQAFIFTYLAGLYISEMSEVGQ